MRNFPGIVVIWTQIYNKVSKSVWVYQKNFPLITSSIKKVKNKTKKKIKQKTKQGVVQIQQRQMYLYKK